MIAERTVSAADWEAATGWHLDETGWCSGDRCIPIAAVQSQSDALAASGNQFDTVRLAEACGRAVVVDEAFGVVAVGPAFGSTDDARLGRRIPDVLLTDRHGAAVRLSSIVDAAVGRRRRMLIHAWAPW